MESRYTLWKCDDGTFDIIDNKHEFDDDGFRRENIAYQNISPELLAEAFVLMHDFGYNLKRRMRDHADKYQTIHLANLRRARS
jgi:hypothetical protein